MWNHSDCQAMRDLFWNYVNGRVPEEVVEQIERHVSECAPCRKELELVRVTCEGISELRRSPAPASLRGWQEVQARLNAAPVRTKRWALPALLPGYAWSLTAAAALGAFWFLMRPSVPNLSDRSDRLAITNEQRQIASRGSNAHTDSTAAANEMSDADLDVIETERQMTVSDAVETSATPLRTGRRAQVPSLRTSSERTYASAGVFRRTRYGSKPRGDRRTSVDYGTVDGGRSGGAGDSGNYVLNSVVVNPETENGADYVMGSVVLARTGVGEDITEARAW